MGFDNGFSDYLANFRFQIFFPWRYWIRHICQYSGRHQMLLIRAEVSDVIEDHFDIYTVVEITHFV